MQYLDATELAAIISAIHRTVQLSLPVILVGAGLPQLPGLAGTAKSYAERLFDFPRIGSLECAPRSPITLEDVRLAAPDVQHQLDNNFFLVRMDPLTPAEKQYLQAMAELGPGPHRSGDIATKLGVKVESVAPRRSVLIQKGMVYSPAHSDTAFTVPLFDEFLRRDPPSGSR